MSFVTGKIALVTGGASGIGLATIKEFLRNGLKGATIADVDTETGERLAREMSATFQPNAHVIFIKTDVSVQEEVEAAFEATIANFGNLDVVVNSAGISDGSVWRRELAVNLGGTIQVCLFAIDKYLTSFRSGDEAVIVNVASMGGLEPLESAPVYCASKHGVIGFSRSLGTQSHYDRSGVRVLAVCPGGTETPLFAAMSSATASSRFIGPQYERLFGKLLADYPVQKVEEVGKGIMQAIEEGKSGSVWIVDLGRTFEFEPPNVIALLGH